MVIEGSAVIKLSFKKKISALKTKKSVMKFIQCIVALSCRCTDFTVRY